ncbi:perlucin-like protein [Crassostrea virginica]
MKIEFYILSIFVYFLYVNAEKRNSDVLLPRIQRLQFQLFKSMQKSVNVLNTATFVTKCSDAGCSKTTHEKVGNVTRVTKCQPGFKEFRDHCYKYVKTERNFFEAEMFCRTQQSSLVEISDAKEEKWIKSIFDKFSSPLWISGTDLSKKGQWKWLSTELPMKFTNWARGQPGNGDEHCVVFTNGWDDYPCSHLEASVCEYSLQKA